MSHTKVCVRCSLPAGQLCSRCNDSYCSIDCQKADWNHHRYICFARPTLIPDLDDLGVKLSSSLMVSPRASNNEAKMATLTTTKADQKENLMEEAKTKPTEVPASRLEVETSAMVTPKAKFKPIARPNGLFKKPEAVNETPKQVKFTESSAPLKFVPIQAMKPLKTVPTIAPVEMNAKKPEQSSRMMFKDQNFRTWPTTKNIKVKLVSIISNNAFYLSENNEDIEEYYKYIDKEIKMYCLDKNPVEYQPIEGEVVLAIFEDEWYRATVLDLEPQGDIKVQFVEYGNVETLKPDMILPTPPFLKFDVCPRLFIIDNMPEELNEKQIEILHSETITITGVKKDDENMLHCQIFGF